MGTVGMALVVGVEAFLFSGLILLIPFATGAARRRNPFEDGQERIERYLRDMPRNHAENHS